MLLVCTKVIIFEKVCTQRCKSLPTSYSWILYTPNMNIGSANVSTYICFKLMDAWGKMDFFYCKVSIYHIICQCHLGPYIISQLERHLLVDLLHVRKTLNTFNRSMLWFKPCNIFDIYHLPNHIQQCWNSIYFSRFTFVPRIICIRKANG